MTEMNKTAADIAKQQMEPEQHFRAIITAPGLLEIEHTLSAPEALEEAELQKYLTEQVQKYIDRNLVFRTAEKVAVKIDRIESLDRQGRGLGLSKSPG